MSMIRLILKEIGGRVQNAAGSINSSGNMFEGSAGNAPSDKIMSKVGMGNSGTNNPTVTQDKDDSGAAETDTAVTDEKITAPDTGDTDTEDIGGDEDAGI